MKQDAWDALVCDVGGMIIRFDPDVALQIEARDDLSCGSLLAAALKSPPGRQARAGETAHKDRKQAMTGLVSEPAIDDWLAYHGELDSEMVALVKASRAT